MIKKLKKLLSVCKQICSFGPLSRRGQNINTKESIQIVHTMVQSEEEHIREEALAILEELSEANDH